MNLITVSIQFFLAFLCVVLLCGVCEYFIATFKKLITEYKEKKAYGEVEGVIVNVKYPNASLNNPMWYRDLRIEKEKDGQKIRRTLTIGIEESRGLKKGDSIKKIKNKIISTQ